MHSEIEGVKMSSARQSIQSFVIQMRLLHLMGLPSGQLVKELESISTLTPQQKKDLRKLTDQEQSIRGNRRKLLRDALLLELHEVEHKHLRTELKKLKKKKKKDK